MCNHRFQNGAVAQMQVPVIGLSKGQGCNVNSHCYRPIKKSAGVFHGTHRRHILYTQSGDTIRSDMTQVIVANAMAVFYLGNRQAALDKPDEHGATDRNHVVVEIKVRVMQDPALGSATLTQPEVSSWALNQHI